MIAELDRWFAKVGVLNSGIARCDPREIGGSQQPPAFSKGRTEEFRFFRPVLENQPAQLKFLLPLLFIVCVFASSPALAQSVPGQPNIIIILADDLGYGDVAFNGCPDYATPNIDSFATDGIWCSSGYVTHPFCSPSRAALIT